MNNRTRKDATRKAARTTVSMPMALLVKATERQQTRGFNNFSAYVQSLVYRDVNEQKAVAA